LAESLLAINLKILLRKTGARLNLKLEVISLHIDTEVPKLPDMGGLTSGSFRWVIRFLPAVSFAKNIYPDFEATVTSLMVYCHSGPLCRELCFFIMFSTTFFSAKINDWSLSRNLLQINPEFGVRMFLEYQLGHSYNSNSCAKK
jgi:hypothetical protein